MNNFIINLLGIKDENIIIDDYFLDEDKNEINVFVSLKKENYYCPKCGSMHCCVHDYRNIKITHSNFISKKCNIIYKKRRYRCKECKYAFFETNYFVYGYNRISDTTLDGILKDLKTTISFLDIANRYNITSQTVLNYMDKYICPKRRILSEVICIDEFKNLSHGKGKYACVLLNYQNGEVLDVLPNRRLDYLQYYFNHISINERKNVKYVVSDMYEGYKHLALTTFPNAILVIDAFHYIRYISDAFNKVRRRIQGLYKNTDIEYKRLKKYWKLLTKDSNKIIDKYNMWSYYDIEMTTLELIKSLRNIHPDINLAYLLKENFFASYKKVKYENAETFLITFINSLNNSLLPEFIEVAKTFKNWLPYIINSFNKDEYGQRMSNGIIEGSNNKIKVLKRVSYGYSDFYHLRNRIMYIFNDNEIPLPIPLDLKQINSVKKAYYKPRKKYEKRSISL